MTSTANTLLNPSAPALPRIRALLALLAQLIFRPNAAQQIDQLFAETEARLARYLLELALRQTGNPYLTADMYDARTIWRGARFDIDIQLRPDAVHPFTRIIANRWRAILVGKYRRMHARRHNFSRKFHMVVRQLNARRAGVPAVRHQSHTQFTPDTPSRIDPPP